MVTPKHSLLILVSAPLIFAGIVTTRPSESWVPLRARTYGDATVSEVTSIYDGDTFTVNIKDYPPIVGERVSVRVYGIDCPELRDKRPEVRELALRAKQATVEALRSAKCVRLRNMRRDKYFRILAEVEIDGCSLEKTLLDSGYAKPYFGETKPKW